MMFSLWYWITCTYGSGGDVDIACIGPCNTRQTCTCTFHTRPPFVFWSRDHSKGSRNHPFHDSQHCNGDQSSPQPLLPGPQCSNLDSAGCKPSSSCSLGEIQDDSVMLFYIGPTLDELWTRKPSQNSGRTSPSGICPLQRTWEDFSNRFWTRSCLRRRGTGTSSSSDAQWPSSQLRCCGDSSGSSSLQSFSTASYQERR